LVWGAAGMGAVVWKGRAYWDGEEKVGMVGGGRGAPLETVYLP
jgi:hypothetical protein